MDNSKLIVNRILQVHEPSAKRLGLDRLEEDRLILAFGPLGGRPDQKVDRLYKGHPALCNGAGRSGIRHVLRV